MTFDTSSGVTTINIDLEGETTPIDLTEIGDVFGDFSSDTTNINSVVTTSSGQMSGSYGNPTYIDDLVLTFRRRRRL
jgi:hypothetical protein